MDEKDELDEWYENEPWEERENPEFEGSDDEEVQEDELENYVADYEGQVRLDRLVSIFHSDSNFSMPALHLAITEAKAGVNVENYMTLASMLHSVAPDDPLATVDEAWVEATTKTAQAETARLEQELKQYKNNLIKESIRVSRPASKTLLTAQMGNEDLGNHFLATGSYVEAAKAYQRMREFCTTTKHLLEMNLKLLYISVVQQNWAAAMSYRAKVVPAPNKDDPTTQAIDAVLTVVAGLAQLSAGNYRSAADRFLAVNPAYISAGPLAGVDFARRMLAPGEVAVYGSLCALATMAPDELRERVLDNQQFHEFVDLELDLGRAVSLFCGHRYTDCLAALDEYAAECRMDMHLRDHFAALHSEVRARSVARWFSVYSVVSLKTVAAVFPERDGGVSTQAEIERMIEEGRLDARIDVVDQVWPRRLRYDR
jgi:COP9 signalosome complex subunit 1